MSLQLGVRLVGASWGDDGYIVAGIDVTRGLVRIPESGGTLQPITELKSSPGLAACA